MSDIDLISIDDVKEIRPLNLSYNFIWEIHKWCNYRCSYCCQNQNEENRTKALTKDNLYARAIIIKRILDDCPGFLTLSLLGGEISYLDLVSLMTVLYSPKIKTLKVTTNLSSPIDVWIKLKEFCDNANIKLKIFPSFHPTQVKLDNFLDKVKTLSDANIYVNYSVILNKDNIEEVRSYCEKTLELGLKAPNIKYERNFGVCEITKEMVALRQKYEQSGKIDVVVTLNGGSLFKVNGFSGLREFFSNLTTKGFKCSYDNGLLRCDTHGFLHLGSCFCHKKLLLNTYTPDVWTAEPITCTKEACSYCNYPHIWRE